MAPSLLLQRARSRWASQGWRDSQSPAVCPPRWVGTWAVQGHSGLLHGPPPHTSYPASPAAYHSQLSPPCPRPPASPLLPHPSLSFRGAGGERWQRGQQRGPKPSPGTRILSRGPGGTFNGLGRLPQPDKPCLTMACCPLLTSLLRPSPWRPIHPHGHFLTDRVLPPLPPAPPSTP